MSARIPKIAMATASFRTPTLYYDRSRPLGAITVNRFRRTRNNTAAQISKVMKATTLKQLPRLTPTAVTVMRPVMPPVTTRRPVASSSIDPKPKVSNPPPFLTESHAGKYQEGDRIISKLSAEFTSDQLDGGSLSGGDEWFILISDDGEVTFEPYRVIGIPEKRYLEWRLHVRPVRKR